MAALDYSLSMGLYIYNLWYGLMTLTFQHYTAVLLIYGGHFLSGIYYCLCVFGVPPRE